MYLSNPNASTFSWASVGFFQAHLPHLSSQCEIHPTIYPASQLRNLARGVRRGMPSSVLRSLWLFCRVCWSTSCLPPLQIPLQKRWSNQDMPFSPLTRSVGLLWMLSRTFTSLLYCEAQNCMLYSSRWGGCTSGKCSGRVVSYQLAMAVFNALRSARSLTFHWTSASSFQKQNLHWATSIQQRDKASKCHWASGMGSNPLIIAVARMPREVGWSQCRCWFFISVQFHVLFTAQMKQGEFRKITHLL